MSKVKGNKEGKATEEATDILNRDAALKVSKTYTIRDNELYGECPSCGHTGLKASVHKFCYWCGQKLGWPEDKLEPLIIDIFDI